MSTTAYKIKVMQAFEDGKTIEFNYDGKWEDFADKNCEPSWTWDRYNYRIKPQAVWYIRDEVTLELGSIRYPTKDLAEQALSHYDNLDKSYNIVEFREK